MMQIMILNKVIQQINNVELGWGQDACEGQGYCTLEPLANLPLLTSSILDQNPADSEVLCGAGSSHVDMSTDENFEELSDA